MSPARRRRVSVRWGRSMLFALGALLASSPMAAGCGPSFQVIYEGNARFEHCYALEESRQRSASEKVDCWRDWSERYTYGQTRDRIHYATERYVTLTESLHVAASRREGSVDPYDAGLVK